MTAKETGAIMDILEAAYPQLYRGQAHEERAKAARLWASMFEEDDCLAVTMAVKAFVATDPKGYPPAIGAIKNKIADMRTPDAMTEYEAWNRVREAIRDGYYRAGEEYAKLPPVLQRLVGSPEQLRSWGTMESETLNTVVASNFMRSYRARAAHERERGMLPGDVQKFMAELAERVKMPELPGEMTESEMNDRRNEIRKLLS